MGFTFTSYTIAFSVAQFDICMEQLKKNFQCLHWIRITTMTNYIQYWRTIVRYPFKFYEVHSCFMFPICFIWIKAHISYQSVSSMTYSVLIYFHMFYFSIFNEDLCNDKTNIPSHNFFFKIRSCNNLSASLKTEIGRR